MADMPFGLTLKIYSPSSLGSSLISAFAIHGVCRIQYHAHVFFHVHGSLGNARIKIGIFDSYADSLTASPRPKTVFGFKTSF